MGSLTTRVGGRGSAIALAIVLLAYVALGVAYNVSVPVGESPDEPTHLQYLLHLRESRRLPVIPEPGETGIVQAKHPPLYYLAGTLATAWLPFPPPLFISNPHFTFNMERPLAPNAFVHLDRERFPYRDAPDALAVHVARLVSLASGLVLVMATFGLGRRVWPDRPHVAWASAAFVAFLPGLAFFSGTFNNDTMANAWSALALLLAVRVAQGDTDRRSLLLLGTVLGLGLMTKMTLLSMGAVAGLAVVVHAARSRDARFLLRGAFWIGAPVLALTGWWVMRNVALYGAGDPLAWKIWSAGSEDLVRDTPLLPEIRAYLYLQWTSFWGSFGWTTIRLPETVYRVLLALAGLSAAGLMIVAIREGRRIPADTRWAVAVIAFGLILGYLTVFRLATTFNMVVAHGRYLYFLLSGFAVLFVTGLTEWAPAATRRWLAAALSVSMLALAVASLVLYVRPAFAEIPFAAAPPASGSVVFGDRVELVASSVIPDRPAAGSAVTVTLHWRALAANWQPFPPPSSSLYVFVHVVDADGEVVGRVDAAPFGGRLPLIGWVPGRVYSETLEVPISTNAPPGVGRVLVGWYLEDRPDVRLAARGNGVPVGDVAVVARPYIASAAPDTTAVPGLEPRGDRFGPSGEVTLAGAAVEAADASGSVTVTLAWSVAAPLAPAFGDLTVFVHLLAPDGTLAATGDGPPQGGRFPTSHWQSGDRIIDVHRLLLPSDWPPGAKFGVHVGLYDPETGERLAAQDASARPWQDRAVPLTPREP